jgi:uncharacterized protein (DUF1697 family)
VVLLRGVNVGGKRPVPKSEFIRVLEQCGFTNVTTYINSGNAVIESAVEPVAADVQKALETHFGFDIPTLIVSGDKIRAIARAIPSDWTNDRHTPEKTGYKSDIVYLFHEANSIDTVTKIGHKPEIEDMLYVDGAVLVRIARKNISRGSMQKVVGTELYQYITIRNLTTAKKLAELVGE